MYIFSFLLFFILSLREEFVRKRRYVNNLWWICFIFMVLHDGLRWETGTDWIPYRVFFEDSLHTKNNIFEYGYVTLNMFVRSYSDNYSLFLLLHAFIIYSLIFKSIKDYSTAPFLSLFIYYVLSLPYLGMNRQFLAIAICFYSLRYVLTERKAIYFFSLIFLAFLFHQTALLFGVCFFLKRKFPIRIYVFVGIAVFILSLTNVLSQGIDFLLNIVTNKNFTMRLETYANADAVGTTGLGAILAYMKRLIWIVPFLIYYSKKKGQMDIKICLFFNIYFLSFLFYMFFNGSQFQIFVSRALFYFNISECILIPYLIHLNRKKILSPLLFTLILLYGYIQLDKGLSAYHRPGKEDIFIPYKSLFINQDLKRRMW